jgi:hypothetical protein
MVAAPQGVERSLCLFVLLECVRMGAWERRFVKRE